MSSLRAVLVGAVLVTASAAAAQSGPGAPLRNLVDDQVVQAIAYCKGEYRLTMVSGTRRRYAEFNIRFKTDTSPNGPPAGKPALLRAGMQGDRVQVIFRDPDDLKRFLVERCEDGAP